MTTTTTALPALTTAERKAIAQFAGRAQPSNHRRALKQQLRDITRDSGTAAIHAFTTGSPPYETTLEALPDGQWRGRCTCSIGTHCIHALSLALSLLQPAPNDPQSGESAPRYAPATDGGASTSRTITALILSLLGRKPETVDQLYAAKLEGLYASAQRHGSLTSDELRAFGLKGRLPSPGLPRYGAVKPWFEFPADPADFLFAVIWAAAPLGVQPPKFLAKLKNVRTPHPRLQEYWHLQESKNWLRQLKDDVATAAREAALPSSEEPVHQEEVREIRLVLTPGEPTIEWRAQGEDDWQLCDEDDFYDWEEDRCDQEFMVAPQSARLWDALNKVLTANGECSVNYDIIAEMLPVLRTIAARDSEKHGLVSARREPIEFQTEPLKWHLAPPAGPRGHYKLELQCPDGRPLTGVLVPGRPPRGLILTGTALWYAPHLPRSLSTAEPTFIPDQAIESEVGMDFLLGLKCPLPARLESLIERIPLHAVIHGKLTPGDESRRIPEFLQLEVHGCGPDGALTELLGEGGWVTSIRHEPIPGRVRLVERSSLDLVTDCLSELRVRWDYFARAWMMKVTSNFPVLFASWARTIPPGTVLDLSPELQSLLLDPMRVDFSLECEPVGTDWFDLRVLVRPEDIHLTPEEVKLLLNSKKGYVRLGAKGWRRLDWELSEETAGQLARLGLEPGDMEGEAQRVHALQLTDPASARFLPAQHVESIRRRAEEIRARVQPPVPTALRAELRPYQIEGYHFLAYLSENRFGGILADDMGLGKTVQALAWIAWLRETRAPGTDTARRVLVACPKSVAPIWKSEAERFLPGFRVAIHGDGPSDDLLEVLPECDALVVNYTQLRLLAPQLAAQDWLIVISDEAQAIKNPDSQTARALRSIKAAHRLALTGTPIENRLLDLWSLMEFAMPGALGNRAQFQKSFGKAGDENARRRLSSRLRPFLLRRTKSQVARDLPPRIEEDIRCELEGVQKSLYQAEYKRARAMLLQVKTHADLDALRFHFLSSLLRLRQICCHPALVDPAHRTEPSAKLEALLDVLEPLMEEGHKVLVFSQFLGMLDILRDTVRERGWKDFVLTGATENRGELVNSFHAHEGAAVFLISLKAGGSGLNLACASYVVLVDPWWNPAVEAQAIDRTHRIGQTSTVIAYRLLVKDSIEDKIRELQKKKRLLADDVLGEERFAQSLTLDDLQVLFSGE